MSKLRLLSLVLLVAIVLTACAAPTNTPVPPTKAPEPTKAAPVVAPPTAVPPTAVPTKPPEPTKVPPTNTPVPPPTPTPPPPPKCDKMANPPTVAAGQFGSADKPLVITFVPSGDTGKITKAGTAIAECLSKMTGLNIKIEVGTTFTASIEAMGANKAQISFLNTTSAILARQKYGIIPAVLALRRYSTNAIDPDKADAGKMLPYYKGQFISSKASGVTKLADLKGKTFCFVDPQSASGYVLPRIILAGNGINPDKDLKATVNAGSHDNVAIGVYKGDCDAGVTYVDVLTDTTANLKGKFPDITDKVSAFAVTDKIPNDGMQYAKTLDPKLQDAITASMLAIAADPGGAAMLAGLYNYNALQKIEPNFYDTFVDYLKKSGYDLSTSIK